MNQSETKRPKAGKVAHVSLFQPIYFAYSIIKRIFALKKWHLCHKFVVQWR